MNHIEIKTELIGIANRWPGNRVVDYSKTTIKDIILLIHDSIDIHRPRIEKEHTGK